MNSFTSYNLHQQTFPEGLPPFRIVLVKALSTLAKLVLPLVLESIYKNMENGNFSSDFTSASLQQESLLSILVKITISLSCSYFLQLYCEYLMTDYRLNIKKELTKRILQNNIRMYSRFKEQGVFYLTQSTTKDNQPNKNDSQPNKKDSQLKKTEQKPEVPRFWEDRLSLWTDISSKMPVYVYNYHASLLGIIFQSLNIVCVCVYLFIKLSYSLFFGLVLALVIMAKIIKVTKKMQTKFFDNIKLRERKLALLKHFFNHLVQYKMTWLDKWIYDKIADTQKEYQQNLQEIKYLDVWCVGLWRFTSISISSVVVIAFYFMGIKATETITPSTLIQFLMILTMPLNALAWQIAGLRNSVRSINQLKFQVSPLIDIEQQDLQTKKQKMKSSQISSLFLQSKKSIKIKFDDSQNQVIYEFSWDIHIDQGSVIEVKGKKQAQNFLSVLPFYLKNSCPGVDEVGYVEENAWQIQNILESISFKDNQKLADKDDSFPTLEQLLEIFDCHDIPQFRTITSKNLSGGQKMRINLVRAFHNSKVVVINSDLSSVDVKMRIQITKGIHYLVDQYSYSVFCRSVELQDQKIPTEQQTQKQVCLSFFCQSSDSNPSQQKQRIIKVNSSSKDFSIIDLGLNKQKTLKQEITVDERLHEKLRNSLKTQIKRYEETEIQEDPEKSYCRNSSQNKNGNNQDNLRWQTFRTYYKSKYHAVFLVGIISTTFFQHFYQYYLNNYVKIEHVHDGSGLTLDNVQYVALLTGVFAIVLFVRSYYFAVANVSESKRIAKQLDQNIIMNQMEFYENLALHQDQSCSQENKLTSKQEQKEEPNEKKEESSAEENKGTGALGNKLIYHSTSDLAELSDRYPWQANILFNDIATTTSSVLIIFSEIPFIGLILIPIIAFTVFMNNQYQIESQRLLKVQKKVEQNLMKTVHEIEEGIRYIYLYNKVQEFKGSVYRSVDKQINIEWRLNELKRVLNTKYKIMMIVFLVVIIFSYGMLGLYTVEPRDDMSYSNTAINLGGNQININNNDRNIRGNEFSIYLSGRWGMCQQGEEELKWGERNKSGKFAMIINYTIILANFMLYLIIRLGETCTPALSIQRVRPILSQANSRQSKERIQDFEKVLTKITNAKSMVIEVPEENEMVSIGNLDFAYKSTAQSKNNVFEGLSLELRRGEQIQIRGKSGNGKTTLYKLLCSLYKKTLNTVQYPFHFSFSPQHPLILPNTHTVSENIDPYRIYQHQSNKNDGLGSDLIQFITSEFKRKSQAQNSEKVESRMNEVRELLDKSVDGLTYREKIMVNNVRAWLYGRQGVKIYDQPYWVDESYEQTYILTTHQREFRHSRRLWLQAKTLVQK